MTETESNLGTDDFPQEDPPPPPLPDGGAGAPREPEDERIEVLLHIVATEIYRKIMRRVGEDLTKPNDRYRILKELTDYCTARTAGSSLSDYIVFNSSAEYDEFIRKVLEAVARMIRRRATFQVIDGKGGLVAFKIAYRLERSTRTCDPGDDGLTQLPPHELRGMAAAVMRQGLIDQGLSLEYAILKKFDSPEVKIFAYITISSILPVFRKGNFVKTGMAC